jgi:hypothetical protein
MLVELFSNLLSSGDFNRDGIDQLGIMLGPCMHDDERLKWVHFTSNIQRNKQTNKQMVPALLPLSSLVYYPKGTDSDKQVLIHR